MVSSRQRVCGRRRINSPMGDAIAFKQVDGALFIATCLFDKIMLDKEMNQEVD